MAKLTIQSLKKMKNDGDPITVASAYDYDSIHLLEEAEIDILTPCDWGIGTTLFGNTTAMQVTIEHIGVLSKSLGSVDKKGVVVAPMPFGSYQVSIEETIRNAARLMKIGADSVKIQGGGSTIDRVRSLCEVGIPCLGHLGYLPQYEKMLGKERIVGDTAEEAAKVYNDAIALQEAGAWGVILQNVPEQIVRAIADRTTFVTIGLGGTLGCDGCMVMTHDLIGAPQNVKPLYSFKYADYYERAIDALNKFCAEVQSLEFPKKENTFEIPDDEYEIFRNNINGAE